MTGFRLGSGSGFDYFLAVDNNVHQTTQFSTCYCRLAPTIIGSSLRKGGKTIFDPYPRYLPLGDQTLIVQYEKQVSVEASEKIQARAAQIRKAKVKGVVQVIPTLSSIAIGYAPHLVTFTRLIEEIHTLREPMSPSVSLETNGSKTLHVPIVYGGRFGPDLAEVTRRTGLSEHEVIRLHSERTYLVYMLGMMASFPYCGDLDERLNLQRRLTPRTKSGKGAVGIADRLTLIYPVSSPSGWNIIGQTPMNIFVPRQEPPSLLLAGDRIKFEPIEAEEAALWDENRQREWNALWNS